MAIALLLFFGSEPSLAFWTRNLERGYVICNDFIEMVYTGIRRSLLVSLLNVLLWSPAPALIAQTLPDSAYQAERQKASDLFQHGKHLEALPLFEDLAKAKPNDDQVLVLLAACLVSHAATLSDPGEAGKERLRARNLLDQASKLGNHSTLALNLSELLKSLPDTGAIKFSDNSQVERAMEAGESAFSRRDFDEAVKYYSEALELDPKDYAATLFIGNAYDRQGEFVKGAQWYERAIQLDPNIETAYRYYADMLAKEGDMAKARAMLIHAAVAEPYNQMVWRELHGWASINHTQLKEVSVSVPAAVQDPPGGAEESPEIAAVWQAYRAVTTKWQTGGEFQKRFPQEGRYRHSLPEEAEALTAAAKLAKELADGPNTASLIANNSSVGLLLELYDTGMIEPYVLFNRADQGIAKDYVAYRVGNRERLEDYLGQFVVPSLANHSSADSPQSR